MGMADLELALDAIQRSDRAWFVGPRDPNLVRRAEQALGVRFPPTYERFVTELGAGSIGGHEFYGVTTDDFAAATVPNGIWLTLAERNLLGLPDRFVIVGDDGMGGYFALDTGADSDESPVVIWAPNAPVVSLADDFGAFIWDEIQSACGPA